MQKTRIHHQQSIKFALPTSTKSSNGNVFTNLSKEKVAKLWVRSMPVYVSVHRMYHNLSISPCEEIICVVMNLCIRQRHSHAQMDAMKYLFLCFYFIYFAEFLFSFSLLLPVSFDLNFLVRYLWPCSHTFCRWF